MKSKVCGIPVDQQNGKAKRDFIVGTYHANFLVTFPIDRSQHFRHTYYSALLFGGQKRPPSPSSTAEIYATTSRVCGASRFGRNEYPTPAALATARSGLS